MQKRIICIRIRIRRIVFRAIMLVADVFKCMLLIVSTSIIPLLAIIGRAFHGQCEEHMDAFADEPPAESRCRLLPNDPVA